MKDFAKIEIFFNAKSLEIMSKAFKQIIEMDETADLELFRNHFDINSSPSTVCQSGSISIAGSLKRFKSSSSVEAKSAGKEESSKQNDKIDENESD